MMGLARTVFGTLPGGDVNGRLLILVHSSSCEACIARCLMAPITIRKAALVLKHAPLLASPLRAWLDMLFVGASLLMYVRHAIFLALVDCRIGCCRSAGRRAT